MKRLLRFVACLAVLFVAANAHAQRAFHQAEIDALLAPIALYPDPLLGHVLNASVFPQDTLAAAAWSRANSHLQPDDALQAVDGYLWHPSVKALVAYPDVLARIAESPQWLADLGQAYTGAYEQLSASVQQLRMRAAASGHLRTDEYQRVYTQAEVIYVQPVYPRVVYAPYYNPLVVYGTWHSPHYRPVYWRPWVHRHPHVVHRPAPVVHHHPHHPHHGHQPHHGHGGGLVKHVQQHPRAMPAPRAVESRPFRAVPEAQRAPIVQGPIHKQAPVTHAAPPRHESRHDHAPRGWNHNKAHHGRHRG